jgi:dolichol-phosphate mannosyltransferase
MYNRIKSTFSEIESEYEIIFVNDGSPDNTLNLIKEISMNDPQVIGINHRRNFGSQAAFLSGMKVSTGDAVVLMDGDLQDPPEMIKSFYEKWQEGYNIVYGVRSKREVSIFIQFLYKAFYRVFNKVAAFKVPVDAGDFSLIDRESVNEMLNFKEFDIFLRAIRAYIGGNQIGITYFRPERMFGKSTNNILKNIGWATKGILSVSRVPLILVSFVSVILFGLGSLSIFGLLLYMLFSETNLSLNVILVLIFVNIFLTLVSVISVAITGEYIGRILEETKDRPKFLVASYIQGGDISKFLVSRQT